MMRAQCLRMLKIFIYCIYLAFFPRALESVEQLEYTLLCETTGQPSSVEKKSDMNDVWIKDALYILV